MITKSISRRRFVGGVAAAIGYAGLRTGSPSLAQSAEPLISGRSGARAGADEYDSLIKLCFNENPFGPTQAVMEAMTGAFKYANRYGYPDGGIVQAIAALHGVQPGNVVLGAGSTEILCLSASALLEGHKKVLGIEPTFGTVFEHATGLKCSAIRLPLDPNYRQDIPAIIKAAKDNAKDLGFIYLCNPNNPTGNIVTRGEIKQLLEGIPSDLPVLVDEAYFHFVDHADYASADSYVREGRPVIVARTFSKIAALAGMRLGYGIAPAGLIERLRPYSDSNGVNALAKWGGVAALKDTEAQAQVKADILSARKKTVAQLEGMGYGVIPSEANFFMVNLRTPVQPVIRAFRERGVLVGRPFPPMLEHLRVSVGTAAEMDRFTEAFRAILGARAA
jgi:histidinol-phosphate aminotransferase